MAPAVYRKRTALQSPFNRKSWETRLMTKKTRLLAGIAVLGFFDAVVPLFPILALVLVYVVFEKPPWFLEIVQDIYGK